MTAKIKNTEELLKEKLEKFTEQRSQVVKRLEEMNTLFLKLEGAIESIHLMLNEIKKEDEPKDSKELVKKE